MTVGDLMTREIVTLGRDEKLSIADSIMHLGRIRHMPVVDEAGMLVGLISQRDLFRGALARAMGIDPVERQRVLDAVSVADVMTTDLRTARADTPLHDAASIMVLHKIGCLPVVDAAGKLVGILTESDFVTYVARTAP